MPSDDQRRPGPGRTGRAPPPAPWPAAPGPPAWCTLPCGLDGPVHGDPCGRGAGVEGPEGRERSVSRQAGAARAPRVAARRARRVRSRLTPPSTSAGARRQRRLERDRGGGRHPRHAERHEGDDQGGVARAGTVGPGQGAGQLAGPEGAHDGERRDGVAGRDDGPQEEPGDRELVAGREQQRVRQLARTRQRLAGQPVGTHAAHDERGDDRGETEAQGDRGASGSGGPCRRTRRRRRGRSRRPAGPRRRSSTRVTAREPALGEPVQAPARRHRRGPA